MTKQKPLRVRNAHFKSSSFLSHFHRLEKNGVSFIETSALDSTNVEQAFQTILTGKDIRGANKMHR